MKVARRELLLLIAGATAFLAMPWLARAQTYPARSVRLILGFAAGGGTDLVARMMGEWLSRQFGQQFVIENRTGTSGNLATEAVMKSPPAAIPYCSLELTAPCTSLYKRLPFEFKRDFVPVAFVMRFFRSRSGAFLVAGQISETIHRLCEKLSGEALVCVVRARNLAAFVRRNVQPPDQNRDVTRPTAVRLPPTGPH